MTPVLWALAGLFAYMAISLRLGDAFPFSKYSMYAGLKGRDEGAVLSVRVGGVETPVASLDRFVGIDPAAIDAAGRPCSQQWVVVEVRRWVAEHLAAEAGPDAVEVELGFRHLRVDGHVLTERFERVAIGRAHPRRRAP